MHKMVAVQTRQGTWIRREDGAHDPLRMVNVAQIYAPPSDEVEGPDLEARFEASEREILQTATLLASAPEMADLLRRLADRDASPADTRRARLDALALLAKVAAQEGA